MIVNRCVPEFPSHWSEKRLKFAAQSVDKKIEGASANGEYLGLENVESWTGRLIANDQETTRESTVNQYEVGDVLFGKLRPYLAKVFEAGITGTASTEFLVLRARQGIVNRFLAYVLRSPVFIEAINAWTYGAKMPRANWEIVGSMPFPMPSPDEQSEIADFLDRETAKADALVAKYERLIELLEEKRTALITQAVTKGLNPAVPMKDSGIEWIGQIPKHWHIEKTKFVAKLKSGHTPSRNHPEYWVDCKIPWVTLTDVGKLRDGRLQYVEETNELISELGLLNSPAQLLPAGTVIVSRTASVGYSAILSRPMATTQDFVNWVCGARIIPEYLLAVFRAMKPEFSRLTNGSVHQTIYMPDVNKFVTPVPLLDEQRQIASKIQRDTTDIFKAIDTIRTAISLTNERRSALITAAVTGQIDVRTYRSQESRELEGAIV